MHAQLAETERQREKRWYWKRWRKSEIYVGRVKLHASFVASLAARRLQPFCCFCVSSVHMTTTAATKGRAK